MNSTSLLKNSLATVLCSIAFVQAQAQQNVGVGTLTPNAKSVLELVSPGNNQGFLMPRLSTAQRTAMVMTAAENGLVVYDNTLNQFYYWNAATSAWVSMGGSASSLQIAYNNGNAIATVAGTPLRVGGAGGFQVEGVTNAGIGTASAANHKLYVKGSTGQLNDLYIETSGGAAALTVSDASGFVSMGTSANINQNLTLGNSLGIMEGGLTPTYYSTFRGADQTAAITYILPSAQASAANQMLTNDGTGILSWATPASGLSGTGTINKLAFWTGTSSLSNTANLHWDNTNQFLGIGTPSPGQRLSVKGDLGIGNNFYTIFTTGAQAADITYTLPTAQAAGAGQVLTNNGAGILSWTLPVSNDWSLGGNTLTAIQSLGTKSNHDLPFVTNNAEVMRLTTTGRLGIGTSLPAVALDVVGAINTSTHYRIGNSVVLTNRGTDNLYVGVAAGNTSSTGISNTFIGANTGTASTSGGYNTAVGEHAGTALSSGFANTMVGEFAGRNVSTGTQNVLLGSDAGLSVSTGSNVTLIGYGADLASPTQRTNATAIGFNAKVDADNTLILGGTGPNSVNVGIGVTTPAHRLSVKGNLGIGDAFYSVFATGAQTDDIFYTLPITPGTANQVLTNTGSGVLAWTTPTTGLSGSGTADQIAFWDNAGTALTSNTGLIWNNAAKQLGIGVATATSKLHINDMANSQGDLRITAGTATGVAGNDGVVVGINASSSYLLNYEATPLTFGTSGATRMTLSATGDLGIGVTPTAGNKLEVNGKTVTSTFQMTSSPSLGYVLTSDASGNATWASPTSVTFGGWSVGGNTLLPTIVGKIGTTSANDVSIMAGGNEGIRIANTNGNVGIGTSVPGTNLHVKGKTTLEDGNQADGKILVSDAAGTAGWMEGTTYTASKTINSSLANVTTTYQKLADVMTFTKAEASTKIELVMTSSLFVDKFNASNLVYFEIRIDNAATTLGTATAFVYSAQENLLVPSTIFAVFPGLPTGGHRVSIWARTVAGTATDATVDIGSLGGQIIVKEIH